MKIDTHIHALPERSIALLRRDPVYRVTLDGMKWHGGNYPDFEITPKWFDPDTALAGMRKNGIDMGIMSAAPKPLFYYEVDQQAAVAIVSPNSRTPIRKISAGWRICRSAFPGPRSICWTMP